MSGGETMQAVRLVETDGMDRLTWLEWRRRGIGSSDAAAVAGLDPYRSPIAVYLDKIGELPLDPGHSEYAYWGTALEPIVAEEFARRTGLEVRPVGAILQHPEHPWMIANIDRVALVDGDEIPVECKTAAAWLANEWADGRVPDRYMIQVQHQLAVTGAPYAYLAVLIGGNTFRWQRIERDNEIIRALIKIESDFWRLVESRTPPALDGSESSTEVLRVLYPEAKAGTEVELPLEAADLIAQYEEAAAAEKAAKERKDEAANRLKALLGEAECGVCGDRRVYWPNIERRDLDTKRLKAERPDVYEQYVRVTTIRQIRIK